MAAHSAPAANLNVPADQPLSGWGAWFRDIARAVNLRAPIESPVFTGDARLAVSPPPGDNDNSIATTEFVKAQNYLTAAAPVYAAPVSAATLTAAAGQDGYQLEPASDLATLNVVMPPTPANNDEFFVASTTTVGLTAAAAAGQTMAPGAAGPITLGTGGRLAWKYLSTPNKWYGQF